MATSTVASADVEGLEEKKEMGRGSYGAVYKVRLHGLPCIAKRLHDILVGRGREEPVSEQQRSVVIDRFREECKLLSDLRHPNVVQFMGVSYGRDEADISLIMEYMHMDLDQCMKTYPDIPLPYKTSILRDVAYGLAYLHSIPIIHRDLNAGNVLLTESLRAKIADLGVAKLFDRDTGMMLTRTLCPGAQDFMPPECLDESPKYNTQLDVFSFGHLTVYLANQKAPRVLAETTVTAADVLNNQIEADKRQEALGQMGVKNPLYSIAVQCLSDTSDQRPTSRDLVSRMEELCEKHSLTYRNTLHQEQEISERVEREIAYKMKEVNASLDEKEKQLTLLQEKQLQKSKENGDLLNEKTLLEEQHVKQMQAMAEYSDSINEKQQKIDAMQQEIWDLKKVDFKNKKSSASQKACASTTVHAAATAHEWCSQDELDACKRKLAEERKRSRELEEQLQKLNTESPEELHTCLKEDTESSKACRLELDITKLEMEVEVLKQIMLETNETMSNIDHFY